MFITELLFDDDPRLVGEIRENSIQAKFLITTNTGTEAKPLYQYNIVVDR